MGKMKKGWWGRAISTVLLFSGFFTACTFHAQIPKENGIAFPDRGNRIPLTAALYVKPVMRNYTFRQPSQEVFFDDILCRYAEATVRDLFREVLILDAMEGGASGKRYDVIVAPELEKTYLHLPQRVASVTMKWTVLDNTGKAIYQNSFMGNGECKGIFHRNTASGECFLRAVRDQFGKARAGLLSSRWWEISR
ncbi:MAG: hypothetical protein M1377_08555 [Deltaproteobacteria bacterium]|nr:hypothetical protein [Deltaproteobacteria bacterium]